MSGFEASRVSAACWRLFALLACCPAACTDESPTSGIEEDVTPDAGVPLPNEWRTLPSLNRTQYVEWSSHDRQPHQFSMWSNGNKDFNNLLGVCAERPPLNLQHVDSSAPCEPGLEGYLIASDDSGPGVIGRMFFTAGRAGSGGRGMFGEERLRIYTDDLETPAYEGALSEWVDGSSKEFPPPLAAWHSGALVSYHAVPYTSKLRVLLDRLREDSVYYYQIGVNRLASRELDHEREADESVKRELWLDGDVSLDAQESADIFLRDSSGTITELAFSLTNDETQILDDVTLRIYWDDSIAAAVDLPLAALFGTGHELSSFETKPMSVRVEDRRTTLSWRLPLPFAHNARVSLVNASGSEYRVRVRIVGAEGTPEEPFGRLHALRNDQRGPFTPQQRYEAAAVEGEGKFVGAWMFMRGLARADGSGPSSGSFLEGDAVAIVDGQTMQGTGLEDYFNAGWYFQDGLYDSDFSALVSLANDTDARTTRVTAVRWHIPDAVEFAKSFNLEFEYGSWEPFIADHYASVVFYYLR